MISIIKGWLKPHEPDTSIFEGKVIRVSGKIRGDYHDWYRYTIKRENEDDFQITQASYLPEFEVGDLVRKIGKYGQLNLVQTSEETQDSAPSVRSEE